MTDNWTQIRDHQDDCLKALEDGKSLPAEALQQLPPWRAVMLARIAQRVRAVHELTRGTVQQLEAEAREAGGSGSLGDWWNRPVP